MKRNSPAWKHGLEHAALSDVGLVRANNQDSLAVAPAEDLKQWYRQGHLFVVADGMGAHAAGELASKLAAEVVEDRYRKSRLLPPHQALLRAVRLANAEVYRRGQSCDDCRGMGTTVSSLAITPYGALVGHVGDSRVYRVRGDLVEQLTFDHSLAWEVCAAEGLSFREVPNYVPRNVITRSVGPHPDVQVDLEGPFPYEPGDVFLLCSDGLSGLLEDREIGAVLRCLPAEEAVRVLVDLALVRGGHDNITAIVVRVNDTLMEKPPDKRIAWQRRMATVAVWLAILLLAVSSFGVIALGYEVLGLVQLGAAMLLGAVAGLHAYHRSWINWEANDQRLGRGPYTKARCAPDEPFATCLAETAQQLQDVAAEQGRGDEFAPLGRHTAQAAAAAQAEDFDQAVREYCHGISFAVSKLTSTA